MSQKIKTSVEIDGSLSASQIANATVDTDKFLVSDNGTVKYRTGAEILSDLGVSPGTASILQHQVKAGVAINKGQAVYVTSADGTNMIVGLASNASEATSSKTMGLLNATVSINGFADVITEGLLTGLNTIGANAGDPVWLGTSGNLIYGLANKPYAPNHLVFIGIVTRVNANNGEIFVKVQNGFELDEIHDVDLKTTTKVNGHLLGYNGSLWVNKTIAEWLGYTPANDSLVVHLSGNETITGTKTFLDNITYFSNNGSYSMQLSNPDDLTSVLRIGASAGTSNITSDGSLGINVGGTINAIGITPNGNTFFSNTITAPAFKTYTGTSSQFLKANGTVDSTIYTPASRTITINGTSYDLSANRSWTVTANETDTLSTVTGRGALTNTPISISAGTLNHVTLGDRFNLVGGSNFHITNNAYYDSGFKYKFADLATKLALQADGILSYQTAVTGTIGSAVTFDTRFSVDSAGNLLSTGSMLSPIFYDSNNTAYYGDFSSTTRQYQAISFGDSSRYSAINTTINGSGAGDKLILYGGASNYDARLLVGADYDMLFKSQGNAAGKGSFKFYSGLNSTLALTIDGTQGLRAGTSYNTSPTGTYFSHTLSGVGTNRVVNFDGNGSTPSVWWTNGNRAYGAIDAQDPGLAFWANNGSGWQKQMEVNYGTVTINTDIRSPIFYDSNNTGYYLDPNGSSNLVNVTASEFYSNGWFRNNTTNTGLYNQVNGNHIYSRQGKRWGVTGNDASGSIWLDFFGNHESTYRGSVHADSVSSIGFLTDNGGWGLRITNNRNAYVHGTDLHINADNAGSSNIVMHDGDEGDRIIHCNSNRVGFLNQSASWGAYCTDNGDWITDTISWAGSSMRAPIFYDSNDTGYYLDPASNSSLNTLSIGGHKTLSALGGNGITGTINAIWGMLKSAGYKMYPDEQFNDGNNGVNVYNNAGGSGITITRKNTGFIDSGVSPMPNSSGWVLEIKHAPGESSGTSPGFGGFTFSTYTGPGSKRMICTFKMKIPVGKTIEWASNSIGSGGGSQWLTSNVGTGQYQDYAYLVHSGTGGWSSTFFFYIVGGSSATFYTYLASATVYDITNVGEENTRIQSASAAMYSPMYYDSDNTAYYMNPSSNSNILSLGATTISTQNFYQNTDGYFQFGFTNNNAAQWPLVRFGPVDVANGWDEGIIKAASTEGVFSRYGMGIHMNSARAFGIYSSGWNKIIGFKSDAVQSYQPLTAPSLQLSGVIEQGNNLARPLTQWGQSGNITGALVIKLPGNTNNYGMIHAVIDVYEYNGNNVCTVIIGGHNWGSQWYNYGAEVVGNTNKQVRVAVKDGRYCIVLGDGSSTWEYGNVILRKIQNGTYYDNVMDLGGAYSIGIESDSYSWVSGNMNVFSSTSVIATSAAYAPIFYDANDSGYYADFDSTSNSAIRVRGGALHGPNPTWGNYLLVGGDGRNGYIDNTTTASVCTTNGNLHIDSASGMGTYINFYDGSVIYFGGGASNIVGSATSAGNLVMAGDITAYGSPSDSRLKTIKEKIPNALESVLKLNGYRFDWKEEGDILKIKEDIGVIAQEVEAVFPELARTNENGYMSVRHQGLTAVLIEAIKEQQTQIEELKELVNKLINK